jgi:hypothetical protein
MTSEQNDHPNLRYNYAKEQAATKAADIYMTQTEQRGPS